MTEQAALLALVKHADQAGRRWHQVADLVEDAGSALRIVAQDWTGLETFDPQDASDLASRVGDEDIATYESLIADLADRGIGLTTVLDDDYPINLRHIHNRPPFLFIRGKLKPQDDYSVAVVGTRTASDEGLSIAGTLSRQLSEKGVTVLSGLAHGIDTAAHEAALEAQGRTVAVMGTGILRVYPDANVELASRIESQGALISQFWPDAPPTKKSFPMRNVVSSGMAIGTVVVEAGSTSGARNQARHALEHGKRLFLIGKLVMHEAWAQRAAQHPSALVVDSVDQILDVLVRLAKPPKQLTLA